MLLYIVLIMMLAVRVKMDPSTIISYWKPEVAIRLVADWTKYPVKYGKN